MKLSLAYTSIVSLVTIAAATSCTSDNALAWPYTPDGGDGTTCDGNIGCEEIVAEGQCNALSLIDDTDTTCVQKLKMLKRAVNLDCTSSEGCFTFLDNSLLCLNQATGDYHDDVGGSGNAITGVYTGPDGKVQTVTGVTAEPTTTAMAGGDSESSSASSASTSGLSASQTTSGTAAAVAASSSSASSASSRSSSASQSSAAAQSSNASQSASSRSSSASQSSAAAQSSNASQSASAAAQTGAAVAQIDRLSGVLVALAMPLVLAVV